MKWILLTMLALSSVLHAEELVEIPVTDVKRTAMDMAFDLDTDESFSKVILDCQSFLHGINIYDEQQRQILQFYLYEPECHEILDFVWDRKTQNKDSCIRLDLEKNAYELLGSCPLD